MLTTNQPTEQWGAGVVICLERGADLHMAQLMPLTVSCFSEIQIGFTFLVPAHLGIPGLRAVNRVCVCVTVTDSLVLCPLLGDEGHITKQSSVLFPGLSVNPPSKEMHVHYTHHRQLDYWDIKQAHGQSASSNLPHNDKLVAASVFRADIARMSIWSSLQCGTIHHL